MSVKISNLRLELDDPEDVLPARAAGRLGLPPEAVVRWRILRKSLDARRHDDLHFMYAMEVDLAEQAARRVPARPDPGVRPFIPERFDWPEPGSRPLEHRPVIIGAGPAG